MAILGTLIDKISAQSFAAAANGAPTTSFATHQHAIGETPHLALPVLTSIEETAGNGYNGAPQLLACGANASVATIGIAYGSGVTVPEVGYEVHSIRWHSLVQ